MYSNKKNISKNLVNLITLPAFVVPRAERHVAHRNDIHSHHANIKAYPCDSICNIANSRFLAEKGGTPSLYTYLTELFNRQCQEPKKSAIARITVALLHRTYRLIDSTFPIARGVIHPTARAAAYVRPPANVIQ